MIQFLADYIGRCGLILMTPTQDGSSGQALVTDGLGNLTFSSVTTSPGGSNAELQYNNAGAFGGITGSSWSGSIVTLPATNVNGDLGLTGGINSGGPFLLVTIGGSNSLLLSSSSAAVYTSDVQSFSITSTTSNWTQWSANTDSYDLTVRKSRGSFGAESAIVSGDALGAINFQGYSGAAGYVTGAQIRAESTGTVATTRVPGKLIFATGTDAAPTVLTDRMTINSAGVIDIASGGFLRRANAVFGNFGNNAFIGNITGGPASSGGLLVDSDGTVLLLSVARIGWSVSDLNNSPDVALHRNAAGVLEISAESAGQYRDLILRNLTAIQGATTTTPITVTGISSHSVPLLKLNMGATPTGNVFEINRSGGSGGDFIGITAAGTINIARNSSGTFLYSAPDLNVFNRLGIGNSSCLIYFGCEDSSGGNIFTGSSAHACVLGTATNHLVQFATIGIVRVTLSGDNLGMGMTAFGTNAAKVLGMANGTAPTTSPADCFQMWSDDHSAGNACPHFRTENGTVIKLYGQPAIESAEVSNAPSGTTQTIDWANGRSQKLDLSGASGDVTITLSNPTATGHFMIRVVQGATARDITWPAAVIWDDVNGEPTWTGDTNLERLVGMYWNGTSYYASASNTYSP